MMPVLQASEYYGIRTAGEGLLCAKAIDDQLPGLDEKLGLAIGCPSKCSGGTENDYPDIRSRGLTLNFFSCKRKVPIPPPILDAQRNGYNLVLSGIFPEIKRAWISVDSTLYLWRYEDGEDVAAFNTLREVVVSAGLVFPVPSMLKPPTKCWLVVVTAVNIQIFGVSFTPETTSAGTNPFGVLHLGDTCLFTLPTDGVVFDVVHGSANGRIFLGGRDGCLYELDYAQKRRWGHHTISKVNHSRSALSFLVPTFITSTLTARADPIVRIVSDATKGMLFTLTSRGALAAYYFGVTDECFMKVGALWEDQVMKAIMDSSTFGTAEKQCIGVLVDITPIAKYESLVMNLVGITDSGIRVYFSCVRDIPPSTGAPCDLKVMHVRLPPGFAANSGPQRPRHVHLAQSSRGISLFASSSSTQWQDQSRLGATNDTLWLLSADLFAMSSAFSECFEFQRIEGTIRCLVEEKTSDLEALMCDDGRPLPPTYVLLQLIKPRMFTLVTMDEVITLEASRPWDQLEYLLSHSDSGIEGNDTLKAFFELVRPDQACVLAMSLACGAKKHGIGNVLAERAARCALAYGFTTPGLKSQMQQMPQQVGYPGQHGPLTPYGGALMGSPLRTQMATMTAARKGGPVTSTPFSGVSASQQPHLMSTFTVGGPSPSGFIAGSGYTEFRSHFCSLHNALYMYLWRVCRPVIANKVTMEVAGGDGKKYLVSAIHDAEASYIIDEIRSFLDFLREHCNLFKVTGVPSSGRVGRQMQMASGGDVGRYHGMGPFSPQGMSSRMPFGMPYSSGYPSLSHATGMPLQHFDLAELATEIRKAERTSVEYLESIADRMVQVLELWKTLIKHPFHSLVADAEETTQQFLRNAHFLDLVVEGQAASTNLINVLIYKYMKDCISIDGLLNTLRKVCPRVYREEDAKCARASELISTAKASSSKLERTRLVDEVMTLCEDVTQNLNLEDMCGELASIAAFRQMVSLCATAARKADPTNLALRFYRQREEDEVVDSTAAELYMKRMECCKPIVGVLYDLLLQTKEIQARTGVYSLLVKRNLTKPTDVRHKWADSESQASQYIEELLAAVVQTDDELVHVALLSFLVEQGLNSFLVELKSPYVESYLRQLTTAHGVNRHVLDNLWRLHEREGSLEDAAAVLVKMAEKRGPELLLRDRMMYYARALSNAKARLARGELSLNRLVMSIQEKMEIGAIQQRALEAVGRKLGISPHMKIRYEAELNEQMYPMEELYSRFIIPLKLHDCQLAIMAATNVHDYRVIEELWEQIVDEELIRSTSVPATARVTQLRSKMAQFAKDFGDNPDFFPVEHLVEHLEARNAELALDCDPDLHPGWVWMLLEFCGASRSRLLNAYDHLYCMAVSAYSKNRRPFHIVRSLASLLLAMAKDGVWSPDADEEEARDEHQRAVDTATSLYEDLQLLNDVRSGDLPRILADLRDAKDLLENRPV